MPRFFFDFHTGGRNRGVDRESLDLDNEEIAKTEAMVSLVQVLQLEQTDDDCRSVGCRVRNDEGKEVYKVSLSFKGVWAGEKDTALKFERVRQG